VGWESSVEWVHFELDGLQQPATPCSSFRILGSSDSEILESCPPHPSSSPLLPDCHHSDPLSDVATYRRRHAEGHGAALAPTTQTHSVGLHTGDESRCVCASPRVREPRGVEHRRVTALGTLDRFLRSDRFER
jgi:hypothetical protein